jgi:hypothetical protein
VTDSALHSIAQSTPITVTAESNGSGGGVLPPNSAAVLSLSGKALSRVSDKDKLSLKCILTNVPAQLNFSGATVDVSVGGAVNDFTLDSKGRGKNGLSNVSVKVMKDNRAVLQMKAVGTFLSNWQDEGLDLAVATPKGSTHFVVYINLNGVLFTADVTVTTKVVVGKFSQFKKL